MKATRFGAAKRDPSRRLVEDEQRHRALGPRRRRQRRVVVDAQVAVEEDDSGLHFAYGDPHGRPAVRDGTRPRTSGSTATSASCCRSCASPCPACRSSSPSCWRCRSSRTSTKSPSFEKSVYFATLLLTAISAALLIAPSAYHRLTFRYQQKHQLVFLANRFAIAGLGFLALAMTGAIMLITDILFGTVMTVVTSAAAFSMFLVLWCAAAAAAAVQVPGAGAAARRSARRPLS